MFYANMGATFGNSILTAVGAQNIGVTDNKYFVWAVHPGDVAAIPEPRAYMLVLAGLALLGLAADKRCRR